MQRSPRRCALLALLLLVPASSVGAIMALMVAPGAIGQAVLVVTKIWMLLLPLIWLVWSDREKIRIPKPGVRELFDGAIVGALMFTTILAAYGLLGKQWINPVEVRAKAQQVGIVTPLVFLAGSIYWTVINSLLEEYVWRWFVFRQCEVLVPGMLAVALSAFCFTLHHMIELSVYFSDWRVVGLGSLAVFAAGAIWSGCYLIYRSIWTCYISHLMADWAIALVGWHLLFG
ncbi:CPBP family intramembrane metalloprotease [Kovacikia minuta CCNUW1]|uniref:CPBP family intramembrane glutamic endopeptidase n=1 Tax=Kovacikia minuta TaxID=2931930 RepID=UPI001CCB54A3|nr:type II CAAX endopeptidase family protein [Kovacikia minuta]UBF24658.1 CPBP family intramembrane metalloprotease [Kovacikia minuta CCNUW1]